MKLLLHICCAPCAVYPVSRLKEAGFEPRGFFYNPNIHPSQEYARRLDALTHFAAVEGLPLDVPEGYDLDGFLVRVAGRGTGRCEQCYRMRLEAAADAARAGGFTLMSTTLLYSRRQKHDLIAGVAREAAADRGLELYYEDFRAGWQQGIDRSKALGLYRQQYCGCVYSEAERFRRPERKP